MNDADEPGVAVRPMIRDDVDGFSAWGAHTDPLYAAYNVPALDRAAADAFWRHLAGRAAERRPYAGLLDGRFAAQLMLRFGGHPEHGEIGIALDPALVGRGVGRRILRAFARYLHREERLGRLTLEVAAYNERAIRAYRAAGFVPAGERFGPPDPGLDFEALAGRRAVREGEHVRRDGGGRWYVRILHMEMRLNAETITESYYA
ncbi:MAG: hypothetical protein NVSMB5_25400 [Candidatus Velthaea sp.]